MATSRTAAAADRAPPADDRKMTFVTAGARLQAELAQGRLRPVYLVTSQAPPPGPQQRYAERVSADPQQLLAVAAQIEAVALRGGDRSLDYVKIDYLDGNYDAIGMHPLIVRECRSVSLFGGRRVVTVVHADEMAFGEGRSKSRKAAKERTDDGDLLEALLDSIDPDDPQPPCVLIVVAEHLHRGGRPFKALGRAGAIVEVPTASVDGLHEYLRDEGAAFGISVERGVAKKIWDRLGGSDAARLRQTANRLLLDAGPRGKVTVQMAEETVPAERDADVFALLNAVADQDPLRALHVLHLQLDLLSGSALEREANRIAGFLSSHTQLTVQVAALQAAGHSEGEITAALKISPGRYYALVRQLNQLPRGRAELNLSIAEALQIALHSGVADSVRWLEQALLAMLRGHPLRLPAAADVIASL
jgi:DNA polymerase III delta subunit